MPAHAAVLLALWARLPGGANRFLGEWQQLKTENYQEYLRDVVGLGWAKLKVAQRIAMQQEIVIEGDTLLCVTRCPGARSVREAMRSGDFTFHEPNAGVTFEVSGQWDGDTFTWRRRHAQINGGKPIVARRWVRSDGVLVSTHDWGGRAPFVTYHVRRGEDALVAGNSSSDEDEEASVTANSTEAAFEWREWCRHRPPRANAALDWVPIVSQVKSLTQALAGDAPAARLTQERFSMQCPIVSQCRSLAESLMGDNAAARRTQLEQLRVLRLRPAHPADEDYACGG